MVLRPFVVFSGGLGPAQPALSHDESLERFGTSAFSAQTIWNYLTNLGGGRLDLSRWFETYVPERYRSQVEPIAVRVFETFRGRKLTDESLYQLARKLSGALGAEVGTPRFTLWIPSRSLT